MIQEEGFKIRHAVPADGPEVARIHVEAWRDSYATLIPADYLARMDVQIETARWSRSISRRADNTLVAEAEGEVVGYAIMGPARGRTIAPSGEVYALYVDTDWREHGVGRALVEAAFEAFRARGLRHAVIWCLEGNFAARGFYQRCGGTLIREARLEEVAGMPLPVIGYHWDV
ncbi:MAG TPA: GNAT family N-acetyltransferase [Dongiaceae bacterium]|jgi:ribosomal protein S18 acetylase RimI-like enzyme|nr:GNAT family N-acetyltransferase [Dongiaceae bacterium]